MILTRCVVVIKESNGATNPAGGLIRRNTRECLWERMDKENPNGYPRTITIKQMYATNADVLKHCMLVELHFTLVRQDKIQNQAGELPLAVGSTDTMLL